MIHVIDGDSFKTLIKAPIPIIGAKHTIRKSIIVTICTWVISFVVRVISDAVEKWLNSSLEKLSTFSKTSFLKARATPAPTFVAKKATEIAATVPSKAIPNIFKPVLKI